MTDVYSESFGTVGLGNQEFSQVRKELWIFGRKWGNAGVDNNLFVETRYTDNKLRDVLYISLKDIKGWCNRSTKESAVHVAVNR